LNPEHNINGKHTLQNGRSNSAATIIALDRTP
jgi:hypothetical protein